MKHYAFVFAVAFIFVGACKKEIQKSLPLEETAFDNGPTDSLKLNQIQIIASHNSYHRHTDDTVFQFLVRANALGILPSSYDPIGIDYSHLPLEQQFNDYGVRGIELDIYNDPNGGQFKHRAGLEMLGLDAEAHIPELDAPGFKILHIPDFDYNTNHYTFKSALVAIYNWSVSHPNHLPIFINIETKQDVPADNPTLASLPFHFTHAVPYDANACDKMDEEIKSVFGDNLDKVITPDDVRGSYSRLDSAARAGNWPTLAESRNKVVFIMQGAAESLYKSGHPSLQGRAMFVYSSPSSAEAAFVILNGPIGSYNQIQQRVQQGFIVRTRADESTNEARSGDYTQMNAAFSSGAQIISTDYYKADYRAGTTGWTDYHVYFPNHELARIDSLSASGQSGLGTIKE